MMNHFLSDKLTGAADHTFVMVIRDNTRCDLVFL